MKRTVNAETVQAGLYHANVSLDSSSFNGRFGHADGAFEDLAAPAVPIQSVLLGPQTRINTASVIAGRLGAGKTFALRHLQVDKRRDGSRSVFLDDHPPALSTLSDIAASARGSFESGLWADAWDRAMLLSLASHWDPFGEELAGELESLELSPTRRELSPFHALDRLSRSRYSHSALIQALRHPGWEVLRDSLTRMSQRRPPFTMLLDGIDNDHSRAPELMLSCQKGLFFAALRWNRNRDLAKRARMVVALRDLVISNIVYNSEHAARYLGAPDVAILDWDPRDLRTMVMLRMTDGKAQDHDESEFLTRLAQVLRLNSPEESAQVWARVLDLSTAVPRDVILILNELSTARSEAGLDGGTSSRVFRRMARLLGRMKVTLAASEILAQSYRYDRAGDYRARLWVLDSPEGAEGLESIHSQVVQLIRVCFAWADGVTSPGVLAKTSEKYFGRDVTDTLWRHSLIGQVSLARRRIHFRTASEWDVGSAPRGTGEVYGPHPSVALLAGLDFAQAPYSVDFGEGW